MHHFKSDSEGKRKKCFSKSRNFRTLLLLDLHNGDIELKKKAVAKKPGGKFNIATCKLVGVQLTLRIIVKIRIKKKR